MQVIVRRVVSGRLISLLKYKNSGVNSVGFVEIPCSVFFQFVVEVDCSRVF